MRKGKHSNNKIKDSIKIIKLFFVILLIISIGYIAYYFLDSNKEKSEINELLNTVETNESISKEIDNKSDRIVKVKKLKEQYPEVVGWIEIEGTNVNYPVMQAKDNDFYMTHD